MVNILDLCSGKWEREEMGGDYEWEIVCTGWNPKAPVMEWGPRPEPCLGVMEASVVPMPPDLLDSDLDMFLARM